MLDTSEYALVLLPTLTHLHTMNWWGERREGGHPKHHLGECDVG